MGYRVTWSWRLLAASSFRRDLALLLLLKFVLVLALYALFFRPVPRPAQDAAATGLAVTGAASPVTPGLHP